MGDTLEQQLICPTCLELPIHPIILNCGHSYCWLCLQQWKKMSSKSLCPQCRVLITVETRGISMDNMIEAIISQLGPTKMEERKRMVELRCAEEQKFRDTGSSVNNKGGGRQANNRNRRGGNRAGNTAPGGGSGGLADNVAGEVVVNTSAPGPSGGAGGGSGNAAAGAEPILVDSDSDDNSDENSDDSLSSLNSQDSDDSLNSQDSDFPDYVSDASDVEGLPGYYYGGYGHCYACGR